MRVLIFSALLTAVFAPFFASEGFIPGFLKYLPELIAAIIAIAILASVTRDPGKFSRGSYLLLFGILFLFVVGGVAVNNVTAGPLFAGMRYYLRALPFFLVPFFFPLSERTLKALFWLLVSAAVIQLPLALEQRAATTFRGSTTGDTTVGTLGLSPYLSLFQICIMTLVIAAYTKNVIKGMTVLLLLSLILLPTMINETKASLLLVPIGLVLTLFIGSRSEHRVQGLFAALMLTTLFAVFFIQIYDYYMVPRWGYGFVEFLTMEGRVENYLDKGAALGSTQVGIIDGIVVPVSHVHGDIVRWAFGYGLGNVSDSALGAQFTGPHYDQFASLLGSSFGVFLLELGVPAMIILGCVVVLLFFDGWKVADTREGYSAVFALATCAMCVIVGVGFGYKDVFHSPAIIFLFALCAGHVASCRSGQPYADPGFATLSMPANPTQPTHLRVRRS